MLSAKILSVALAMTPLPGDAPRARWVVDYADMECSLSRTAADGHTARIAIVVTPGGAGFVIRFFDAGLGRLPRPVPNVGVSVQPGGPLLSNAVLTPYRSGRQVVYASPIIEDGHLDSLASGTMLRITRNGQNRAAFPLPGVRNAVAVLRQCVDDQLRAWGIDPVLHRSLRSRPAPVDGVIASTFRFADYPESAIRAGHEGRTVARLSIAADGSIAACTAVASSGHAELDERTCAVLSSRARYRPALDADGNPIAAMAIVSVSWNLP
jgi:TonB family protein